MIEFIMSSVVSSIELFWSTPALFTSASSLLYLTMRVSSLSGEAYFLQMTFTRRSVIALASVRSISPSTA